MSGFYTCANCGDDFDPSNSNAPHSLEFCSYHCEEEQDAKDAKEARGSAGGFSSSSSRSNQTDTKPAYVPREPRSIRKVNMYTTVGFIIGLIGCFFNFVFTYTDDDNMLAVSIMLFMGIILMIPLPDVYDKLKSKIPEEKKCAYTYIVAIIVLFILW